MICFYILKCTFIIYIIDYTYYWITLHIYASIVHVLIFLLNI